MLTASLLFALQKTKGVHIAGNQSEQRLGDLNGTSCLHNVSTCVEGTTISLVLKYSSQNGYILSTARSGLRTVIWIEDDLIRKVEL